MNRSVDSPGPTSACWRASSVCWRPCSGSSPTSTAKSARRSKPRRSGARKTACSKARRAWGRRSPADGWPRRRSSARSTVVRSPPRRPGAVDASVGPVEGQELHRRRTRRRAQRPLHGRNGGGQAQSPAQGLLRAPYRRREREDGRADCRGAKTAHHPQRHASRDGEPWTEPEAHA